VPARARGVALSLSLLAHAGLAALAIQHARTSVVAGATDSAHLEFETRIDVSTPDTDLATSPFAPSMASVSAGEQVPVVQHLTGAAAPVSRATASAAVVASSVEASVPARASRAESPAPARASDEVHERESDRESAAPREVASVPLALPHFVLNTPAVTAGSVAPRPGTLSVGAATPAATSASQLIREAEADRPATLLLGVPPKYSAAAEAAGVEADVPLEIVVASTGGVVTARSLQHVGYGLDDAALSAVRSYRFRPALRAGKAVAVRMRWFMRFQLR
jgi:TonB family protein